MISTSLKVTAIDHVVLWVSDLQRSKEFYIGLLGMRVAHESDWQSFLWCGEQQMVALFEKRDGDGVAGGRELNHMALRLASGEFAEVKATLEALAELRSTEDINRLRGRTPNHPEAAA